MVRQNGRVSTTFPRTKSSRRGYSVDEVEEFLEEARLAYTSEGSGAPIDAARIRTVAFGMQRGGYVTQAVDAALERLEEAFAARERAARGTVVPDAGLLQQKRDIAQQVVDRLARPAGDRFRRVSVFASGYRRDEVDALADRISAHLTSGAPLTATEVRNSAFRAQRGGYREAQVDLLLDDVVDLILTLDQG